MKRVLITGGHGFIGRNLAEKLCDDYDLYLPSSEELDLLDQSAVADYLSQNRITHVIHTAVYNQRRRNIFRDRELSANLHMFFTLAEHASELEKLIYLGSGAEYDKRRPIVMAEESAIGECLPLMNDYGLSKYLMNLHARVSDNIYNLRLFGVFGPYEDWRTCFISNLCCKALHDLPLTIRRECRFDFLYVDDLVEPLRWLLEEKPHYFKVFAKPVLASAAMGAVAWAVHGLCARFLSGGYLQESLATLAAIGAAVVVYFILVLALRLITREDLKMVPKGDKIAALLRIR